LGCRQDEGSPSTMVDGDELDGRDKSFDDLDNGSPAVKFGSRRDSGPRGSLWWRWLGRGSTSGNDRWWPAHGGRQ
jgi:hypothetical protein